MGYGKTVIHYGSTSSGDTTNVGPVYLKDCGQRNQLGGGSGIYHKGQDCYVDYGTDKTLISTTDVMLSNTAGIDHTGVIAQGVNNGWWTVSVVADS